jgi:hypothetical protein
MCKSGTRKAIHPVDASRRRFAQQRAVRAIFVAEFGVPVRDSRWHGGEVASSYGRHRSALKEPPARGHEARGSPLSAGRIVGFVCTTRVQPARSASGQYGQRASTLPAAAGLAAT